MSDTFGARLRRRREEQGISLAAIAEQTKIGASLLDALERDDVSHWPSGIFRRAFIRAYGRAIRLDEDAIVREFLELYPDAAELAAREARAQAQASADAAAAGGAERPPATGFRSLVGSALSRLRGVPEAHAPEASPAPLPAADPVPPSAPAPVVRVEDSAGPDLSAVAHLCTEFSRVDSATEVQPLLGEALRVLDAKGLIVWVWDAAASVLRPALAAGYSRRMVACLPAVGRDADNPTAAAFRSAEPSAIQARADSSGALAVPLLTRAGCMGVLAVELQHGNGHLTSACAVATILAASLAQLIGSAPTASPSVEPLPSV